MKQRYFLELAFDGSAYFGWQIQANQISVQETISTILSKLYNEKIDIVGCGRTDTGVHAKQYFAHFDAPTERTNLFERIKLMFPKDIQLLKIHKVSNEAHARYDATNRSYSYFIHQRKNIFKRHYSLGIDIKNLNTNLIQQACELFKKEKNYFPLSKKNDLLDNYNSTVTKAEWLINKDEESIVFNVSANRFLHHQIRRMVGVLIHIGTNKINIEELENAMKNNTSLIYNNKVPANGLFLHSIQYPFI